MSQMVKFITFYQVFDDKITGCNNCKNQKRVPILNGYRFDMQILIRKTRTYILWESIFWAVISIISNLSKEHSVFKKKYPYEWKKIGN